MLLSKTHNSLINYELYDQVLDSTSTLAKGATLYYHQDVEDDMANAVEQTPMKDIEKNKYVVDEETGEQNDGYKYGRVTLDLLDSSIMDLDYPKHSYWRYYDRKVDEESASCRLCGRQIRMGCKASTGGMMRHMKFVHKQLFIAFMAERLRNQRHISNGNPKTRTILKREEDKLNASDGFTPKKRSKRSQQSKQEETKGIHFALFAHNDENPSAMNATSQSKCTTSCLAQYQQQIQKDKHPDLINMDAPSNLELNQNLNDALQNSLKLLSNYQNKANSSKHLFKNVLDCSSLSYSEIAQRIAAAREQQQKAGKEIDALTAEMLRRAANTSNYASS